MKKKLDKPTADTSADTWFVYIVRCADGSLYTGIGKDIDRRLDQHNEGVASRYTRGRLPVSLEYQEEQPNQSMALKRELAIKAFSRKAKESLIRVEAEFVEFDEGRAFTNLRVGCHEQRLEAAWLQVCRQHDLLCLHAGGRNGE